MRDVVLLFDSACPNIHQARANLLRAFSATSLPAVWREVDLAGQDTPDEWKAFGSPTILVEGMDVSGEARADRATCRLYVGVGQVARAPSVEQIAARLRALPLSPRWECESERLRRPEDGEIHSPEHKP